MYSEIAGHLDTLDIIASRSLKQAYLALLLAAAAGGLEVRQRALANEYELQFRDADGRQPCAAVLTADTLLFCLRRPILDLQPGLALAAIQRFPDQLASDPASMSEVRIRLNSVGEVEDLIEFLRLRPRLVSLGYGARISA